MFEDNKLRIKNDNWKINVLLLILLLANIVLFIGLAVYSYYLPEIEIDMATIQNIFTVIAAIIIMGYISTRLPQFRKLGDSAIYEIGYLIIIGIFSIIISYFNKSTNTEEIVAPFLEMFKVLSVMLIFTIIATKTKPFKERIKGNITRKNQIFCLFIFTALGIIASLYTVNVDGTPANVRCLIVMIGGLFGGPIVGIPAGIISGAFRFTQGGATALPCAISTILSGIIGSMIFRWNDKKFPRTIPSILLIFLFTGFEMILIVMLTPNSISFPYLRNIYPLMAFTSVLGMILFRMIIKESNQKDKTEISYEELKIREFENVLDDYNDRIEELENELDDLKNKK